MNKTGIFIARLLGTITCGIVAPFVYMCVRFHLFTTKTSFTFGLWGVVCLIIIATGLGLIIKCYLEGMRTKYSYMKQVVSGLIKIVIPTLLAVGILIWLRDNLNYVVEILLMLIPCEVGAILLNPLPKWAFENNVDGISEIADKVFEKRQNTTTTSGGSVSASKESKKE